jgi:hypothetical protein
MPIGHGALCMHPQRGPGDTPDPVITESLNTVWQSILAEHGRFAPNALLSLLFRQPTRFCQWERWLQIGD